MKHIAFAFCCKQDMKLASEKLEVARRLTVLAASLMSSSATKAHHKTEQPFVDAVRYTLEQQCVTQAVLLRATDAIGLDTSSMTSLADHIVEFLLNRANSGNRIRRRAFADFLLAHAHVLRSEAYILLSGLC